MLSTSIKRRALVLGATAMGVAGVASAQAVKKPQVVKIVVGFPPGQATDTVARLLAEKLGPVTGHTYIVDNKPGQGGSIAMGHVAKSPADGSVMMLTHMSAVATTPHLYKSVPYDSLKDFEAVGLLADLPFVLVCNPSLPFNNVEQMVRYAKENPGKLTNSSSGNGTVSHLAMEQFKTRAGIDVLHVPYRGSAPGLNDLMAGQTSISLETAAAVKPLVQSGKLKALGVGTLKRLEAFPGVPTIAEQGYKDFNAITWLMAIYPAGTDRQLVSETFSAMNKAMQTPDVDAKMRQINAIPRFSNSPTEASTYMKSEFSMWGEVVKRSGVQLD